MAMTTMTAMTGRKVPSRKGGWGVPVALVALSAPPLVAGALRLVTLAGVAEIMPGSEARAAVPLPVVVHIVSAAVFAILGALQFAAGFRRRRPGWHRAWMTRAYAIGLGAGTQMFTGLVASLIVGPPTELSRALQDGAGWAINLAVAEWAIRRRWAPHRGELPVRMSRRRATPTYVPTGAS